MKRNNLFIFIFVLMVSLDGTTSFIGHEFIKLLNTGSSHLATEAFVLANGGSGGGTGTTDLTDYYDKSETDNLLLNKLNINNPQDMSGTLRIGHVAGTSKMILNAVASDKDFYVNGDAQINGNLLATSIDSNSFVQCGNVNVSNDVKTNIIDSYGISDITLKRNTFDICYLKSNSLELNAGIDLVAPAQVQANIYNSFDDSSVLHLRNGNEFMRFRKTEDDILMSKEVNLSDLIFTSLKGNFISNNDSGTDLKFQINSNDFITLSVAGDKIEIDKDIEMHSSALKSNVLDTWTDTDLVIKRNGVNKVSLTNNDFITENNINLVSQGQVKCDIINSYGDDNLSIRRYGTEYLLLNNNPSPITIPCVQVASGIGFTTENFFANEYRSKDDNVNISFYGGNASASGKVNYMTYKRLCEDITFYRDVNIDGSYYIKGNNFDSNSDTNVEFHRNGVLMLRLEDAVDVEPEVVLPWGNSLRTPTIKTNEIKPRSYTIDTNFYGGNSAGDGEVKFMGFDASAEELLIFKDISISNGITLSGDIIIGNSIRSADSYANRFRIKYFTEDTTFDGATLDQTNRFTFMVYRHLHQDLRILRDVLIDAGYKIQSNIYDSSGNNDVVFQRNGVDYMTFKVDKIETAKAITVLSSGVQARLEDTNGDYMSLYGGKNIDTYATGATSQRLNINYYSKGDVMLGNDTTPSDCSINKFPVAGKALAVAGVINTDTGIETDAIDTATNTDLYIKRNAIDYIQLGGTSLRTRCLTGVQSDIYDSLENSDVSFRRNGIVFFYLRNGKVEMNSGIDLNTHVVNSKGDNDIAFERNSVEYFKLTEINAELFVLFW